MKNSNDPMFAYQHVNTLTTWFFRFWFIWAALVLCGAAGILYVVWHFLSKVW